MIKEKIYNQSDCKHDFFIRYDDEPDAPPQVFVYSDKMCHMTYETHYSILNSKYTSDLVEKAESQEKNIYRSDQFQKRWTNIVYCDVFLLDLPFRYCFYIKKTDDNKELIEFLMKLDGEYPDYRDAPHQDIL